MIRLLLTLISLLGVASAGMTPGAAKDLITDLPGVPEGVTFNMYAGYIDVSRKGDSTTRSMFYWYTESQSTTAATDPLLLWTNGGPGCSGLSGFMTEQGPFRPTASGNLTMNPHAWNRIANTVFIEQPVGVGFSRVVGDIAYGDEPSAMDNYAFVTGFLDRFPQLKSNDFYITSESYGGHYMPTLARELVNRGGVPSFKGVAVGNPLTYMPYRNYGQYGTAYGHQLLPKPLWDQYTSADCKTTFPASAACNAITDKMDTILGGFDAYALDFPTCLDSGKASGRAERWSMINTLHRANGGRNTGGYFPDKYEACSSDWAGTYLNRADVQAAIHANPQNPWSQCSNAVGSKFNVTDVNQPMMPVWKEVIAKAPHLKIMIYSGDDDSVCATLGTQQFIWDMGFTLKSGASSSWQPWKSTEGQVAGFRTEFNEAQFVTVHGAGHMVPSTRPEQCLTMLSHFLADSW